MNLLFLKEHKVEPDWACMIVITYVEHYSMESSGSDSGHQVNKCLLNPYYTPNSPEFSIRSPFNIPVL